MVSCVRLDGSIKQFRIQKLFGFDGLKRVEINEAKAGGYCSSCRSYGYFCW